jgi:protein-disulfide isomerase
VLDQIFREYPGRVRLIFKDFPLSFHELARPAHEAARCAGAFGKYWAYHDQLFAAQPRFERERLIEYAAAVGIDRAAFTQCVEERRFAAAVEEDVAQARGLGVTGTPTFVVNGKGLVGAHPVETFRQVIDEALNAKR